MRASAFSTARRLTSVVLGLSPFQSGLRELSHLVLSGSGMIRSREGGGPNSVEGGGQPCPLSRLFCLVCMAECLGPQELLAVELTAEPVARTEGYHL